MDFQYAFRQAHQDRLEDAGLVQYQFVEGYAVVENKPKERRISVKKLRLLLISIINRIMR